MSKLTAFESAHRVENYEVRGRAVWPLLRIRSTWQRFRTLANPEPGEVSGGIHRYTGGLTSLWKDRIGKTIKRGVNRISPGGGRDRWGDMSPIATRADMVICAPSERRVKLNGLWFNRSADPMTDIANDCGNRMVFWETGQLRYPRAKPSCCIDAPLDHQTSAIRDQFFEQFRASPPDWFEGVQQQLFATEGFDFDWSDFAEDVALYFARYNIFQQWLRRVGCTVVVVDNWYNPLNMALVCVANDLGLHTVELQHGQQLTSHFAYGQWHRKPLKGYACVPKYAWVWGHNGESLWKSEHSPGSLPIVGGNPWLNTWRKLEVEGGDWRPGGSRIGQSKRHPAKTILVTEQWTMRYEHLFETIRCSPASWKWIFRLHPLTTPERRNALINRLKRLNHPNLCWIEADQCLLYECFRTVDIHLTGYSTCASEALAFGIPTVLLHDDGVGTFQSFIDAGVMFDGVKDDLFELIDRIEDVSEACREQASSLFASSSQSMAAFKFLTSLETESQHVPQE